MRPDIKGLEIAPAIPSSWDSFKIEKTFRGKKLNITFDNSAHVESGVVKLIVNGEELAGNYLPEEKLADVNDVVAVMG